MQQSNVQLETHPALQLLAARPDLFRRGGHVAASWRQRDGRKFGPYFRLAYRDGDRQHSIYLGGAGPLVEQVRQQLAAIQRPYTERRALCQVEREVRTSLRLEKRHFSQLLRPLGLRLKGFELRGIRLSPLRRILPLRGFRLPRLSATKPPTPHPNRDSRATRMAKFLAARDRLQGGEG